MRKRRNGDGDRRVSSIKMGEGDCGVFLSLGSRNLLIAIDYSMYYVHISFFVCLYQWKTPKGF